MQALFESHQKLLIVVKAYKASILDKIDPNHPSVLAITEITDEAIKIEKSIARTTDL